MRLARTSCLLLVLAGCGKTEGRRIAGTPANSYGLGRAPTAAEIEAIDVDVNPVGVGLPPGQGTAATGAIVYAQKCALCHGPKGEGIDKNPRLVGREPPPGFVFATDFKAPKTIGNYWPYATTLYDYIHRTMPFNAPGSLTPDETYGVVAWLLVENGHIPAGHTIDARSLPAVKLPAQRHLVPDNRTGGQGFR